MFNFKKFFKFDSGEGWRSAICSLPNRSVHLNLDVDQNDQHSHMNHYCSNEVISSQYTLINFIPKNVFRQFKRAANLFFLLMTIIQLQPTFAIGSPFLAVLPLLSVLVITALKDGLEDWRRHISDRLSNDRLVNLIQNFKNSNMLSSNRSSTFTLFSKIKKILGIAGNSEFPSFWLEANLNSYDPNSPPIVSPVKWKNVRVGDVLVLTSGDFVPADLLILYSSNDEGLCFADSKDLDGETNLKPRNSLAETSSISSPQDINSLKLSVDCSAPSENMFNFNCKVNIHKPDGSIKESSATIRNTLLRGMVVRNTDVVIALVLYTGSQTKIVLNSGPPPFKRSRIEIMMNKMVIANFGFLFFLSVAICIAGTYYYSNYDQSRANLLFVDGSQSVSAYAIQLFVYSLVMLQNIIPISLYISIEFVKVFHAFFILQDINMYYEPKNISCTPRNWSISDDMGQIGYIFSDKTGTLTNNVMDFRFCAINGIVYGKQLPGDELDVVKGNIASKQVEATNNEIESRSFSPTNSNPQSPENTPLLQVPQSTNNSKYDDAQLKIIREYESTLKKSFTPKYISTSDIDNGCPSLTYGFVDPTIFHHMNPKSYSNSSKWEYPKWTNSEQQAGYIDFFLTQMAVNHTVLVESSKASDSSLTSKSSKKNTKSLPNPFKKSSRNNKTNDSDSSKNKSLPDIPATNTNSNPNSIKYSAESADEGALVLAARNFGYTFIGRNREELYLDIKGTKFTFTVLASLEFDSVRKRMSSIVRRPHPHNDIILFTKGADSGMLDIIKKVDVDDEVSLNRHREMFNQIDEFANSGLRTLVFGYRKIPESELETFMSSYQAAQNYIGNDRDEKLLQVYSTIEKDLEFVASTGIEDRLQDKVPECIASLRAAGIKIWVLTGDKLETAINIGFASNLLSKNMELWTLDGKKSAADTLNQFWLMSRLIRESSNLIQNGSESSSNLELNSNETKLLKKMSHKIKKMTKYLNIFSSNKEKTLNDHQIVNRSIRSLQMNLDDSRSSIMVMQPFDTYQDDYATPKYIDNNSILESNVGMEQQNEPENKPATFEDALVVDGRALAYILADEKANEELRALSPVFKSVICARASPLQKAQVVNLIKKGHSYITLAVGDGANDVSMIQAADVGVAIVGEEGLQAANAADYSVPRFHHLQNLLLVHGFFNYLRVSSAVNIFFYKNTIWALAPFFFTFYSRFSGNFFFNPYYIQLYNLVFTSIPVIVLGCVDKPFNYKTARIYTNVYKSGINNEYFSNRKFLIAMLDGVYQSFIVFFSVYFILGSGNFIQSNGKLWSLFDSSSAVACLVVFCATFSVIISVWSLNWIMIASAIFSIASFFISTVVFSVIPYSTIYGIIQSLLSSLQFYAVMIIAIIVALLPRYLKVYNDRILSPKDVDIVREIKLLHRPWYGQVYVDIKDEAQQGLSDNNDHVNYNSYDVDNEKRK
ncbi:Phospholipid-transporting ATPase DNF2 [Smittium culicis]|uniref:Phospholipid-transporting ATPase DNF2 n=1 Tax=Smittium culicis TaxID=133412 RepID=A0A1R1YHV1_9FUNG|nr:Phospholipid-transporting ATPase DNF2 [Smittium culicis]